MPRFSCLVKIFTYFFSSYLKVLIKFKAAYLDTQAGENAVKCFFQRHCRITLHSPSIHFINISKTFLKRKEVVFCYSLQYIVLMIIFLLLFTAFKRCARSCVNGNCVPSSNSYFCSCHSGYIGGNCNVMFGPPSLG